MKRKRKVPNSINLNNLYVNTGGDEHTSLLTDNSTSSFDGHVSVYFRDVRAHLIQHISEFRYVFGCVAWLTDLSVMQQLHACDGVSVVIQKEDFLRPDITTQSGWTSQLRHAYGQLPSVCRWSLAGDYSSGTSYVPDESAVRCAGVQNAARQSAWPRMHNKFLVFCSAKPSHHASCTDLVCYCGADQKVGPWRGEATYGIRYTPEAVWTGSFNMSVNASLSLENGVFIRDLKIADAYFKEFQQIYGASEPLDWEHTWVAPEFRIGT